MTLKLPRALLGALSICFAIGFMPAVAQAQAPDGKYQCWFMSSARGGLNFTLAGATYTDVQGKSGTVSISGNDMAFNGGALDTVRAHFRGGNPPTVSILGPRGDEVSACQLKR